MWTATYEFLFTQKSENPWSAYGAFVNVYAFAVSGSHLQEMAAEALNEDGFHVVEMTDLFEFDSEQSDLTDEELAFIYGQLEEGSRIAYGYINTYPKEGLDG